MSTIQQSDQIDPISGLAINCHNCIHCDHSSLGVAFDKCKKTGGDYCEYVHKKQSYGHLCKNYSAWAPRQKTILELISYKIRKVLSGTSNVS
jgi:hypothetical protein